MFCKNLIYNNHSLNKIKLWLNKIHFLFLSIKIINQDLLQPLFFKL